ncbi:caprin-2 isoform X1 [Synchiropus splendidus]|uniref:caprin-2 isoform X1 n=1 Tax=Synchiropus splendidus TaxID=270530 RepID=UPI00237D4153|nr:caprin-2 isoform X1 [Synchiropus splendidus]
MVQLSAAVDVSPSPERSREVEEEPLALLGTGSPKSGSPGRLSLEVCSAYHGYDNYIEDGLICLKHKVRNMEKKKLKLEEYKKRLDRGEILNKDQMAAVEKYEQVLHNLAFAQELHKTLDSLTQELLVAQKKVVKREEVAKRDSERCRLNTVLQIQQLLGSLQLDHVRKDLLTGQNQAPVLPPHQLQHLVQLAALLGVTKDNSLSLDRRMEKAAQAYLDLLDGKDKPVVGTTFKQLKEELSELLSSEYFICLPAPPPPVKPLDVPLTSSNTKVKPKPNEVKEFFNRLYLSDMATPPTQSGKEVLTMTEQEPPDSWDMELVEEPDSAEVSKPWRGAATFIPKVSASKKQSMCGKRRKGNKAKIEQSNKLASHTEMPVEVFNSPTFLPQDPVLRKRHLEDFMTNCDGSFCFMQDSLLDGEASPSTVPSRLKLHGSQSSLGLRSPVDIPLKTLHSTPLPARLLERKASLTNGDPSLQSFQQGFSPKNLSRELLHLTERKKFPSPPLYCRESPISVSLEKNRPHTPVAGSGKQSPLSRVVSRSSTPSQDQSFSTPPSRRTLSSTHYKNIQAVLEQTALPTQKCVGACKPDFGEPVLITTSTQTPPEFAPFPQQGYFLSPGQMGANGGRPGPPHYSRRSLRGGAYVPHGPVRESGPHIYAGWESGYQQGYHHGGRHNSAPWSDSSQVSSPEREAEFTIVDSGHGDSLSASTMEVPLTPHGHHTTLLPMPVYPLSQPIRVAFTASRTANFAPGNLDQPIVFDQLHSNLGDMYDSRIGRFTCPVNGIYVFIFHILKLAINIPLYINLMRNEEVMVSAYANDGAPDHETASNHAILPLFQGDQVWLRLHRGAIYGSTWKYSTFSGFLLYQD